MDISKEYLFLLWLGVGCQLVVSDIVTDPCSSLNILPDMAYRGINSTRGSAGKSISDRYLIPRGGKWYRIEGKEPDAEEGTVTKQACMIAPGSVCVHRMDIKIKQCTGYTVYFLKQPSTSPSGYCFVPKKYGDVAPTYNIPKPTTAVRLDNKTMAKLQFVCNFVPSPHEDLYYEVFWKIDGEIVYITNAAQKASLDTLVLNEGKDQFRMLGVNVACAVRSRNTPDGIPGPVSPTSEQFYAGIKVVTPSVLVHRSRTAHSPASIRLKPTVPIGCPSDFSECLVTIEVNIPDNYNSGQCNGQIGSVQPSESQHCGVQIKHHEWDKEHNMDVFWLDNQAYHVHIDNYRVSLTTIENLYNSLWSNIRLGDVSVQIEDETHIWKGKECHAICDPHMRTFDGRDYENQNSGTFILYQHDDDSRKAQVQMKVTECNSGARPQPWCVCAIAVRAGGDVFVIDRCPGVYIPIFKFRSCQDHILDVRKLNENQYKIYLPSGSYLSVHLWHYTGKDVMDLHMYPSTADTHHTQGLCGTLNGNTNDDFTKPDGHVLRANQNNAFAQSWSVSDNENLITMTPERLAGLESWNRTVQFCTCNAKGQGDGPVNNITCSQDTIATCAKTERKVESQNHCRIKTSRSFHRKSVQTFPGHVSRRKRGATGKTYNESTARDYCQSFLSRSQSYESCSRDVTATNPKSSVDTCVLDIMYTQTTVWASSSRESLKSICLKELKQNTTYQEDDSDDQPSIAQRIHEVTCPNECSGNGRCDNGSCDCHPNFGAADCSIDIRVPPEIYDVNSGTNSTCDIQVCDMAVVEGETFIEIGNLTCQYQFSGISMNGTEVFSKNFTTPGQFNTLVEVFCPRPELWNTHERETAVPFAYKWSVAVSNDGEHYGEVTDLVIYNAECQTILDRDDLTLGLNENYCFISGICAQNGEKDKTDPCSVCSINESRFEWSRNYDYCLIDGVCVSNGTLAKDNNCSMCNVGLSSEHWSHNPDYCLVNGLCVSDGTVKDGDNCSICDVSKMIDQWSGNPDYCLIEGQCLSDNFNVSSCQICNVTQTRTEWTLLSGYCLINDICFPDKISSDEDDCLVCDVNKTLSAWSGNTGHCVVDGKCITHNSRNVNTSCLMCDVTKTSSHWTLDSGFCLIDNRCVQDNVTLDGNECWVCNVKKSTSAWSSNTDHCLINGVCFTHNSSSPNNTCLKCDVNRSRTSWSQICKEMESTTQLPSSTALKSTAKLLSPAKIALTTETSLETTTPPEMSSDSTTPASASQHQLNTTPESQPQPNTTAESDVTHDNKGQRQKSFAWTSAPVLGTGFIVLGIVLYRRRKRFRSKTDSSSYKVAYVASTSENK